MRQRDGSPPGSGPAIDVERRSWHIASRWQEYDGELRACLLRSIFVLIYYSVHLATYLLQPDRTMAAKTFHMQLTGICAGWLFLCLAVFLALKSKLLPGWLKYVTSAIDLGLVTAIAWLGLAASSPLIYAYCVVITVSGLRFRLGLVWFSTLGAMAGYLCLVGKSDPAWFDSHHVTPLETQGVVLVTFAAVGIITGQWIRSSRVAAIGYQSRMESLATMETLEPKS